MFIKSTVIPETEEEQPKRKFSENNNMASISSRPYLSVLNPRSAQSSSDMEFLHSPIQTHKSNTITKSRGDITHIPLRPPYESSSSSLQQKLRHILKRGGSVNSLRHDKTQSVVHYKSLRKSETVLVLSSHQFPTQSTFSKQQQKQQLNVLNGGTSTEKIRPMNRWRHSTHSIGLVSSSSCSSHLSHHDSARQITTTTTTTTQSNRASGIDFPPASLENINQIGSRNVFSESWSSNVQNIAAIDTKLDEQQTNNTGTKKKHITTTTTIKIFHPFTCKMCLVDIEKEEEETTLLQCNCQFCTECLRAYIDFEISEGAYDISCPDSQCPAQGNITLAEITQLTTSSLLKKHHRYRLNREIELDKWRAWCPRAGCETICYVDREAENNSELQTSTSNLNEVGIKLNDMTKKSVPVECPTCHDKFCLVCRKTWHPDKICKGNGQWLISEGLNEIGLTFDNDVIKGCPMCGVLIEKDDGCAQMMCKRCKHVFCWYCLESLDDDFLLRHYDKGPCKNKLGHSRASIIWHRAQVIGIFAGFGILLLIASPLLLLAAPCIICCKCRSCGDINRNEVKDDIDDVSPNLQS